MRLRVGKIFQDKYLPYVTVGATWAGVEASSITRNGTTKEKKHSADGRLALVSQ